MTMASTSRIPPRKRFPMHSPVDEPATRPAMSTNSRVAPTTFFDLLISASARRRGAGTWAMPTWLSVVENGWAATGTEAPVMALKSDDLPALGRLTRPRRSIAARVTGDPGLAPAVWAIRYGESARIAHSGNAAAQAAGRRP